MKTGVNISDLGLEYDFFRHDTKSKSDKRKDR